MMLNLGMLKTSRKSYFKELEICERNSKPVFGLQRFNFNVLRAY